MQPGLFPSATLAEFYRLALLLTGSSKKAESVMAETLHEVEPQIGQFRSETSRHAWLATRIRDRCLNNQNGDAPPAPRLLREELEPGAKAEILPIEAYLLAQRFHTLPEPERSALALFYLEFFSASEIAQVLKMDPEELCGALGRARAMLQEALNGRPANGAPST